MCSGQEVCPSPQTGQEEKQDQVKPGEGEREKSKDIDRLLVLIKPGIVSMLKERKILVPTTHVRIDCYVTRHLIMWAKTEIFSHIRVERPASNEF